MLSTWQLTGLAACCAVLAASLGITIVSALVTTSDHKAMFGHLMQDPLWFDDGQQVVFFGADSRHSPMLITFLALASSYDAAIYIIIMVTGLAVFRSIKEASKYMSAKTKYMQSQMNRVLFAEAGSVTVVGVIPVAIAMYMLVFRLTHVGLGIWLTVLFAWIPIVNPITTIFLVAPYRRQLFGRIARTLCKNTSYMSKWSSMEARSQSKVAPMGSQMGSQIRSGPISNGVL